MSDVLCVLLIVYASNYVLGLIALLCASSVLVYVYVLSSTVCFYVLSRDSECVTSH